jgi:hypothetical protein
VSASLSLPALELATFLELSATDDQQRQSLKETAADDVADLFLILPGLRRGIGQVSAPLKGQETSKQL